MNELFHGITSEEIVASEDEKLKEALVEQFGNFIVGLTATAMPNVVFLQTFDDSENSNNDKWKTILYKKSKKVSTVGEVTLDNIDQVELDGDEDRYVFFKAVETNFENIFIQMIPELYKIKEV